MCLGKRSTTTPGVNTTDAISRSSARVRTGLSPPRLRFVRPSGPVEAEAVAPGEGLRDVGTEAFEQLFAEGHVEEIAAGSSVEFRARLEALLRPASCVLPALLSEIGVNIIDAHAFSRKDRSITEFTVECWPIEDPKGLHKVNKGLWSGFGSATTNLLLPFHTDDYESDINATLLNIGEKVTSGSCGVMFHGTHSGAKIAFGILSLAYLDQNAWSRFTKAICTSRDAHHANIARLLGPCTKPRQFCTTTEYMSEGSLFCFLHNEHVVLDLPTLLKLAQDGWRRIDNLCNKGTVHWNVNPADLLKHKDHVVGLGKFGLPPSKDQEKARTAKTETHKSMVPEFQSCGCCETTLATIQSLDRLVPVLEKILEQLSKQCTVPQESHGTESVESLATEEEAKKLMEMFNKIMKICKQYFGEMR